MKPLRITFNLGRPMVDSDQPLHLDGLLSWARVQEARESGSPDPVSLQHEIPLEQHNGENGTVFKASILVGDVQTRFTKTENRRNNEEKMVGDIEKGLLRYSGKKLPVTNYSKPWLFSYGMKFVPQLTAWAIGDPQRIEELLSRVSVLGQRRRHGYGNITSIEVVEDQAANSLWEHRLMPEAKPGYAPVAAPLTAPYWDRTRSVLAYMPIQKLEVA